MKFIELLSTYVKKFVAPLSNPIGSFANHLPTPAS